MRVSSREGDITYSLSYASAPDGQDLLELRTARFKGKRSVTAPIRLR